MYKAVCTIFCVAYVLSSGLDTEILDNTVLFMVSWYFLFGNSLTLKNFEKIKETSFKIC